jgi:hypothetical protein
VPELRLGVFVATNTEGGGQLSDPLPARVVERFYAPPRQAPASGALNVADATRMYAGNYLSTRRSYSGLEGFILRLQAVMPVTVSPDGYLLASAGPQTRRFVPADSPDLFRSVDDPLAFKFEQENGRATRITIVPIAFERVGLLYHTNTLVLTAALALIAAGATLIGLVLRLGRNVPARGFQRIAGGIQFVVAALWFVSAVCFGIWAAGASDITNIFYNWPSPLIRIASAAALAATVMTFATVLMLPGIWRRNSQDEGWSSWRKLRFTVMVVTSAFLGVLLAAWGALQPWA